MREHVIAGEEPAGGTVAQDDVAAGVARRRDRLEVAVGQRQALPSSTQASGAVKSVACSSLEARAPAPSRTGTPSSLLSSRAWV